MSSITSKFYKTGDGGRGHTPSKTTADTTSSAARTPSDLGEGRREGEGVEGGEREGGGGGGGGGGGREGVKEVRDDGEGWDDEKWEVSIV